MIKRQKKIIIYILLVVLPSILCTFIYSNNAYNKEKNDIADNASWIASVHEQQMDKIVGETRTTLEVIATTLTHNQQFKTHLKTELQDIYYKNPLYGGLYLFKPNGEFIVGTNDELKDYHLNTKNYILELELTHQTTVSNQEETLQNNEHVIAIATPVLHHDSINGILIAHLRTDYVANIIKMLTPGTFVQFENNAGKPIFSSHNEKVIKSGNDHFVIKNLDSVPWKIAVKCSNPDKKVILIHSLLFFSIIIIILSVIYLFFYSLSIKRQAHRERRQTEQQKLELVGSLAASTAHEIRNPLTGIKGFIQLMSEKYIEPADQYYFSIIEKEINRINQIVNEFLILGKPSIQKLEEIQLSDIISDLNPLIISEAHWYKVDYEFEIAKEDMKILASKDQLKQVILNVTKNALEAMPNGGKLILNLIKVNNHALLTVTDNGCGISPEELKKVFTPFYTSKNDGTGLGLVVCRRIVQSFEGEISISSKYNNGTEVKIILPLFKG